MPLTAFAPSLNAGTAGLRAIIGLLLVLGAMACFGGPSRATTGGDAGDGLAQAEAAYLKMIAGRDSAAARDAINAVVTAAIAHAPEHAEAIIVDAVTIVPDRRDDIVASVTQNYPELEIMVTSLALEPQETTKPWSGEVDLAILHATGNSPNDVLGLRGTVDYTSGRWTHAGLLTWDFAQDNESRNVARLVARTDTRYFVTDRFYGEGVLKFVADKDNGRRWSMLEVIGPGYKVLDEKTLMLDLAAGPGLQQIREDNDDGGRLRNNALVGAIAKFRWLFMEGASLSNSLLVLNDTEQIEVDNRTALTFDMVDPFKFRLSYDVRYDSDPDGDNTNKTDTLTKASIVYGF
jgi:putative salt-induced outer membrane protein